MSKKVFMKPFVQKIEFDSKEVIATSSSCYGSVANKISGTDQVSTSNCDTTTSTASYIGWNSKNPGEI